MDAEGFLIKLGYKYRKKGGELETDCPYCKKQKHFYLNVKKEVWKCQRCFRSGGLWDLRLDFDPDSKPFIKSRKPIKYIKKEEYKKVENNYLQQQRKISQAIIDEYQVEFKPYHVGFIYRTLDGEPYVKKWRNTKDKKFFSEPNEPIHFPYGVERLNYQKDSCILCEGEIDVLSYRTYEFNNVLGIPGAGNFKGEWIDICRNFKEVYLSLDMDEAGEAGTSKIIEKLVDYCVVKRIRLPMKDINECLMAGVVHEKIAGAFDCAEEYKSKDYASFKDIDVPMPSAQDYGIPTGFDELDKKSQLRMGELDIYTGHTKVGKTQFITALVANLLEKDVPVLFCSFEMTLKAIKKKLISLGLGKSYYHIEDEKELDYINNYYENKPIVFLNHYGSVKIDELIAKIEYADKFFDTKFVVLDNLQFIMGKRAANKAEEIGDSIRKIKTLNAKLENHIFLICHPTKVSNNADVNENTLRGSSEIGQLCDNLYVVRVDRENNMTEIDLRYSRSDLATSGVVQFNFNHQIGSYSERIYKERI